MSWYGKHALLTRDEVREMLPPGACKFCVYWFRLAIGTQPEHWYHQHPNCERCGIPKWELLRRLTREYGPRISPDV